MSNETELQVRNIEDCKFKVVILCADCKAVLNDSEEMTAKEVKDRWTQLALTSGFVAGKCKEGCRSTFSDLNINTNLGIVDVETKTQISYGVLNYLFGKFYFDDVNRVCTCKLEPSKEFYYQSASYPTVHGRCGKWLEPYERKER